MSDIKDFVIEDGVLKKYTGNDAEVVIPDGVTSIGSGAFYGCSSLTTITIPDSVASIGDIAFYSCKNLTTITIPDSVTSIGFSAFSLCEKLTTITITDSVTSIGDWAFNGCLKLRAINVDESNTEYSSLEGVLFDKDKKTIVAYPSGKSSEYNIPVGVTSIGDSAFSWCENLTTITIPDSVTSIGRGAFSYCKNLTTITIPDSVKSMGKDALGGCNKLRVINLPQNITSFKASSLEVIWDALSKTELKEVVLKSFITQLPIDLLKDADLSKKIKANKKFIIDNIMKNDDSEALANFLNLYKTIKIDELNEYIEKAKDSVNVSAFLLDYKNKNYTIEKQEKIESDKLDKELGLKERTLAEWKKIYTFDVNGDEATITGYKGVDLNVIIPSNIDKYKVVAIADNVFSPEATGLRKDIKEIRGKIESIVILESVVRIGNYAFECCKNLTTITIPDSVTSIGDWAFSGCKNLTTITIPDSVTSIGAWAFYGCKNLTTITIPDSVTSIDGMAFYECENLTTITIPDSVTSIGGGAFEGCKNLTTITIPDSVTSIGENAFFSTSYYNNQSNWENGVLHIGNHLIEAKEEISGAYTIRNGTKTIADNAFEGCESLTSITIPDSVTSIGGSAFSYCTNLTTITIPDSVTSIGAWAFSECTNLTTITIPDSVTSIGAWAFSECTNLTSITIPDSVTSIGEEAFYNCEKLTIHAPKGSYAEQYAKENEINFVAE